MTIIPLFLLHIALLISSESVAQSTDVTREAMTSTTEAGIEPSQLRGSVPPDNSDLSRNSQSMKKPTGLKFIYREDRSDVGAYRDNRSNQIVTFSAADDLRKRNCYGAGFPMAFAGKDCHTGQVHALALSDMSQCKTIVVRATLSPDSTLDRAETLATRLGLIRADIWTNQVLLKLTRAVPGKRFIRPESRSEGNAGAWEPSHDCFIKLELNLLELADDVGLLVQGDYAIGRQFHYILPKDLIAMRGKTNELMGVPIESISGSGTYWAHANSKALANTMNDIEAVMMDRLILHLSGKLK